MKKLIGFQKGVNLGGWLSQGSKEKKHLDTFIVEDDIKRIASMGCDHLRLPVDFENIEEDGVIKESGINYIKTCVEWCKKYKLNVVLDLHKTCGYIFDDPEYSKNFFGNKVLEDRFLNLWDNLSKIFAPYTDMMMFEMLNEVTDFSYSDLWNDLALRCIKVIRKNAPKVKILFGGVGYSSVSAVKLMPKPVDENIIYNVHCYEPVIFTHQGAYWMDKMPLDFRCGYPFGEEQIDFIKSIPAANCGPFREDPVNTIKSLGKDFFMRIFKEPVEICEANNTSLYCGEYGVIDLAKPEDELVWLKDINACFEEYGIGRCIWSYKKMDFGIVDDRLKDVYDELIKYL